MGIKHEANFGTLFRHWVRVHWRITAAFELKQTKTDSIPFSDVQEHQLDALNAVHFSEFLYKIADDSRGVKPFDMVYFNRERAFVVIRYPKFFCLISVEMFHREKNISKRKSLTSERARVIATEVVDL